MTRPWAPAAILVGTGAAATALSWWFAQHSLGGARWAFLAPVAVWLPFWVVGSTAASRVRSRGLALVLIVVVAAALRLAAVTGTPSVSSDLYRYGWDAHVQLSGIDPYRYPPAAAQLRGLRQPLWFPDPAGCAHIGQQPGCTTLNRPGVRTIYPPVAEAWFDAVALVYPGHDGREWQIAGGLVDLATVGLLMLGLSRLGRNPRQSAWYALSPLPVIEFACNGHVDVVAVLLLVGALLALERGRRALAGVLIGLAAMVKLYPGLALVGAWKRGRWTMVAAAAGVSVLAYAPHVAAVGTRVVGYLPGYLREERYDSAQRFLLLGLLPVGAHWLTALAAAALVVAAAYVIWTGIEPVAATAVVFSAALLVATPVQPWYAVVLGALGVLIGAPRLFLLALLAEPYFAAVILNTSHQIAIGRLCYGLALIGLLAGSRLTRWISGAIESPPSRTLEIPECPDRAAKTGF